MVPTAERQPPTIPAGLHLASIARRAVGAVIDQLLVLLPVAVIAVALGLRPGESISDDELLALNAATVGVACVYETLMIGWWGRTVGKVASGTRVVRSDNGAAVSWLAAAQRAVVPLVFSAVPEIGVLLAGLVYAPALFSPLRQGLHDRAAGTIVVRHT